MAVTEAEEWEVGVGAGEAEEVVGEPMATKEDGEDRNMDKIMRTRSEDFPEKNLQTRYRQSV